MSFIRLDVALFQKGLCTSRTTAQKAIAQGQVFVNDSPAVKASLMVTDADIFRVDSPDHYVSRGAYKLLAALQAFPISVNQLLCADIGASTGGFTQVLLEKGARHVYAIDVGSNQLAQQLQDDLRVTSIEHCNARALQNDSLPAPVDCIVYDVSFISATLLLPAMRRIAHENAWIIGLIKPQFEAGRQAIGKKGIVKKPSDHLRSICAIRNSAEQNGLFMTALIPSPILGGDGNREYLCLLQPEGNSVSESTIQAVVEQACKA